MLETIIDNSQNTMQSNVFAWLTCEGSKRS